MLIEEYCPQEVMQQLEQEHWNLTMSDADISTYTNRLYDLATHCSNLMNLEYKKLEMYI